MKLGQWPAMAAGRFIRGARGTGESANAPPGIAPRAWRARNSSLCWANIRELFREFDPEPFAARRWARCTVYHYQRDAVAIKSNTRHPLRDWKTTSNSSGPDAGRPGDRSPSRALVAEVERGILEETDYLNEAQTSNSSARN